MGVVKQELLCILTIQYLQLKDGWKYESIMCVMTSKYCLFIILVHDLCQDAVTGEPELFSH